MVALQIISKIIASQDISILEDNLLTPDYFTGYENEIRFILDHNEKYGTPPDKATFLSKFDIDLVEVNESDKYLVDTIREEYLYYKSVPVVQKVAELLKTDANAASQYMIEAVKTLQPNYGLGGVNIITDADERYKEFIERKENQDEWFFTSGFPELDDLIHGIQRRAELLVLFARTNQGKSWVLEKMCTHIWQLGYNVGYVSAEMDADSIGYRFDTLYKNFSNTALMWGKDDVVEDDYKAYADELNEHKNKFIVSAPKDFNRKITVSKLKNWVAQYKLDIVAVDGITYLADERHQRGDNKTTSLTNISEDLMELSIELEVPVVVVVQANRQGVAENEDDDSTPDLENIRDSDGIAFNASKVLSLRQLKNKVLVLEVKKQRFGSVGGKVYYNWDIDKGQFINIPSYDNSSSNTSVPHTRTMKPTSVEDVF